MSYRDDTTLANAASAARAAKARQEEEGGTATREAGTALVRVQELLNAEALEGWLPPMNTERTEVWEAHLRDAIRAPLLRAWREYLGAEDS